MTPTNRLGKTRIYRRFTSRKTPGRVGSSVIDHGEENRLKRLTAASTPLRGGGVWLPLHGAMVGADSLAG
ncbi:hypothetical protein B9S53_16420 [Arthrospira sp. O9.13F]|nr:hypothetical protein B9S53_16420 [Arthrospira sp. O9.13F]